MDRIRKFTKKYCIKELAVIFFISTVLFFIFYAKYDEYLIDIGREAYIPWQMLKGKILYKDIFNVYGPLGYQINAILFSIFGTSLNTLYLAGFFNSLIILFSTFFISKLFVSKKTSLCITGLTIFICVYAKNFFDFIFAYSYNAIYALSGFLLSVLSILLYIKNRSKTALLAGFMFAGFAFANKIEYFPYFCFLFLCLPIFAKRDCKKYVFSVLAFLCFPVLSFCALFLQGLDTTDLYNAYELIKKLIHAPSTTYFYTTNGLYFNIQRTKEALLIFWEVMKVIIPYSIFLYAIEYLREKYKINNALTEILLIACTIILISKNIKSLVLYRDGLFSWLGLIVLIILLVSAVIFVKKLVSGSILRRDKMFLFLVISTILASFKGLFSIYTNTYGTFNLAVLFAPAVIFFIKYLPVNYTNKILLNKTINQLCIAAMLGCFAVTMYRTVKTELYVIKQPRGIIATRTIYGDQNALISYIKNNTPKNAKILTVPEGVTVNFLAERDSDNFYYYLMPVNVDIFGAETIIENLKKSPPDYILQNNLGYSAYNKGGIFSYLTGFYEFLEQEYTPVLQLNAPVSFTLYKKISG